MNLPRHFRVVARWYLAGFFLLAITNGLATVIPWLIKQVVDDIAEVATAADAASGLWLQNNRIFQGLIIVIIAVAIARGIIRIYSRRAIFFAAREVEYSIRNDFMAHVESLELSSFYRFSTGDLMSRASNDLGNVRAALGFGILNLLNTLLVYVLVIPMMMAMDWRLTVVALLPFPVIIILVRRLSKQMYERSEQVQRLLADVSAFTEERLTHIAAVKAFNREDREELQFKDFSQQLFRATLRLAVLQSGIFPLLMFAGGVGTVLVLWMGGWYVVHGQMTIGEFVGFQVYLAAIAWPTLALGYLLALWQRGLASYHRLQEVFAEPGAPTRTLSLKSGLYPIQLRGVSYLYPGKTRPVLRGIDLTVMQNQRVAIVGAIGSGKSTLLALMSGVLPATSGRIEIGGLPIDDLLRSELTRQISSVPQESFLFSKTIAENIAFGLPDASIDQIEEAARLACVHDDIQQFKNGYRTLVGERGVALSGGQRQRVCLARALIRKSPILLLDDVFSSLDRETESLLLRNLMSTSTAETLIVATHRLGAIVGFDRIVVLDDGAFVQLGSHATLIREPGRYQDLYRRQELERQLEAMG